MLFSLFRNKRLGFPPPSLLYTFQLAQTEDISRELLLTLHLMYNFEPLSNLLSYLNFKAHQ